ncbi:unnamed protein product, partial [Closterium sp. NIES-53]
TPLLHTHNPRMMAEPRAIPFILRLLVAWVTYYYTTFYENVAKSFVGLIESGVFEDADEQSSSSGDDTGEKRRHRASVRRRRHALWVEDLQHMRENDFQDIFKINRAILDHVNSGMRQYLEPIVHRSIITVDTALLIPIKYLASGISYVDMSYLFGVSKTLCHELVDVLLTEFPSVFKAAWVRFPTRDELPEMAREFAAIKGVPAVVGAVDGTHIHMKGMEGHRAEYWTRKSAYAVQLRITCDARGRIWDYLIGYPGSAHDMRVFKDSALLERLHNGDIAPYQIVGDVAYPLREYCLTPLHAPRGEDLMDNWAQCFNYCQSATRMAVERCIGAFKGRWRIFGGRNDCRLWRILAGAACCVILHNLCEEMAVVRRKNMAWFNLTRNRDSWWTRGAIATHKWEPCVPPTQ